MVENRKVDLHIHSAYSDGTLYPKELIKKIVENNIGVFSVTDHDTTEANEEMAVLAGENNLVYIPGVEITSTYWDREIHLLVFGTNLNNQELQSLLEFNCGIRKAFDMALLCHLQNKGLDVSEADYHAYAFNPEDGGWKSKNYLASKGIVQSLDEYFKITFEMDYKMIFKDSLEVIKLVKDLGLQVILAHPPAYEKKHPLTQDALDLFLNAGLDGIECYSPYFKNEEHSEHYARYCQENDLMITCGSDYHGDFLPQRQLGAGMLTYDRLRLKNLL